MPVTVLQGGNPEVKPEQADTYTVGLIYRPQWLEGLDVSVDWLSVNLEGSIEQFLAQDIVNACYVQGNQDQCKNISPDPNGEFALINQTYQNVSKAKISGRRHGDWVFDAVRAAGARGRLSARLFASYLDENSTTSSAGIKTDRAGQVGGAPLLFSLPHRKATANLSYNRGPFTGFLQLRYIGPGVYDTQNGIGTNNWILGG